MAGVLRRCVVLASFALATCPPVRAATPPGSLVLTSSRGSAHVEVASLPAFSIPRYPELVPPFVTWRGCGRYRGFFLEPLDGPALGGGAVDFADFSFGSLRRLPTPLGGYALAPDDDRQPAFQQGDRFGFPAGRYRVHVLGEGACEIRLTAPELRGARRITASRATHVRFLRDDMDLTRGAADLQADVVGMPFEVDGPDVYAIAVTHLYREAPMAGSVPVPAGDHVETCIDGGTTGPAPGACPTSPDPAFEHSARVYYHRNDVAVQQQHAGFLSGGLAEGRHHSKHAVSSGVGRHTSAVAVLLTFVP